MEDKKSDVSQSNNKPIYFLIIGVLLMLVAPFVLTRPAFNSILDLSDYGEIGDVIGGTTAPIINLIGAVLIFYSFREQQKANKIQFDGLNKEIEQNKIQFELNQQTTNYNVILELIKDIETLFEAERNIYASYDYTTVKYIEYLAVCIGEDGNINYGKHTSEIEALLNDFDYLSKTINLINTQNLSDTQRWILSFRLINYMESSFATYLDSIFNMVTLEMDTKFLHDFNILIAILSNARQVLRDY